MKKLSSVIVKQLVLSSLIVLILLFLALNMFFRYRMTYMARERIRESLPVIADEVMMMLDGRDMHPGKRPGEHMQFMRTMVIRVYDQSGVLVREFPRKVNDKKLVKITEEPFSMQSGYVMDVYIRENLLMNEREKDLISIFFWYSVWIIVVLTGVFMVIARNISKRITSFLHRQKQTLMAIAGGNFRMSINAEYEEFYSLKASIDSMTERLRLEEERKKDFIVNFSHDIRTPLTVIRGTVEGIGDALIPVNDKTVSGILSEIQRIETLASKAKDFDRHEGNNELIRVFEAVTRIAKKYSSMTVRCSDTDEELCAERSDIERMIENILSNAYKYNSKPNKECTVSIQREQTCIMIRFRDNGDGIAHEHLPFVFEKFYREDNARSSVPGTGLGLAIVRDIVAKYNGTVEARSEKNVFTEIIVRLPLSQ